MSFEASPETRLQAFLAGRPWTPLEKLAGDASTRLYYRVGLATGGTRILAIHPEPFDASDNPFLEAQALFRELTVRVPHVFEVFGPKGLMVLEDLGDELLQNAVEERPGEKRAWYRGAVDILARLQSRARDLPKQRHRALSFGFDEGKFYDELVFFRAHFLEGLRGARPDTGDKQSLDESFEALARELVAQPYALCHRDYHARNLLLCGEELAVIDFQDARMGPRVYDLVSLLNDSYVSHTPDLAGEMRARFAAATGADVDAEYDLAALQRNLKALGTFGYQISERGNAVYEPYLAPTLALVRENLERNPRFVTLRRVLAKFVEELN